MAYKLQIPQQTQLPNTVGGVKPPYELADQSGFINAGQAVEQTAGMTLRNIIELRAGNEYSKFLGDSKTAEAEFTDYVKNNPFATEDQLKIAQDELMKKIQLSANSLTTNLARNKANQSILSTKGDLREYTNQLVHETVLGQQITIMNASIEDAISRGDTEAVANAYSFNGALFSEGEMQPRQELGGKSLYELSLRKDIEKAMVVKQKAIEEQAKQAVNSIKPLIKETLQSSETWQKEKRFTKDDRREAYQMVSERLNELVESGVITKDEAFDAELSLNNDVDNYAAEFTKQEKDAEKATANELYTDFTNRLIKGNLTADEVIEAMPNKNEKDIWRGIMSGSYNDPPEQTDWDGYLEATGLVAKYTSGAVSKSDALRQLLQQRYLQDAKDATGKGIRITDSLFKMTVNRINNPYPPDVAHDLIGTMKIVEEELTPSIFRRRKSEQATAIRVNTALMSWLDRASEDGKYPTGKEMYNKAVELNMKFKKTLPSEGNRLYEIGDTIPKGGYTYEIIGFDRDGMPKVDKTPLELR